MASVSAAAATRTDAPINPEQRPAEFESLQDLLEPGNEATAENNAGGRTSAPPAAIGPPPQIPKKLYAAQFDLAAIMRRKGPRGGYLDACRDLKVLVPCGRVLREPEATDLALHYHGLSPEDPQAILQDNLRLQKLDLTGNGLLHGGRGVAETLKYNTTLTHLCLASCHLSSDSLQCLASMLQENATLVSLSVADNRVNDAHAAQFAQALRANTALAHLDLAHNEIGDTGALALGQGLGANHTLRTLRLSWNQIRSRGAVAFCTGARENASLRTLELDHNGLGNDCGTPLSQYVARASSLATLNLRHTRIGDAVVALLCRVLDLKASLTSLDLSDNPLLTDLGAGTLAKTLQTMKWTRLTMQNLSLSREVRAKLEDLLQAKHDMILEL